MAFQAVAKGDVETVKALVKEDKTVLEVRDEKTGNSLLHAAVSARNLELVKFFLAGAAGQVDVNATNSAGDTALHLLVKAGNVSMRAVMIADFLIKAGADPRILDKEGKTAVEIVKESGSSGAFTDQLLKVLTQPLVATASTNPAATISRPGQASPDFAKLKKSDEARKLEGSNEGPVEKLERSNSLEKLLAIRIPDTRPVPYKKAASARPRSVSPTKPVRPSTPPTEPLEDSYSPSWTETVLGENEKLRAENSALRTELNKCRTLLSKMDSKQQLRVMYSRLLQLEALETALNSMSFWLPSSVSLLCN